MRGIGAWDLGGIGIFALYRVFLVNFACRAVYSLVFFIFIFVRSCRIPIIHLLMYSTLATPSFSVFPLHPLPRQANPALACLELRSCHLTPVGVKALARLLRPSASAASASSTASSYQSGSSVSDFGDIGVDFSALRLRCASVQKMKIYHGTNTAIPSNNHYVSHSQTRTFGSKVGDLYFLTHFSFVSLLWFNLTHSPASIRLSAPCARLVEFDLGDNHLVGSEGAAHIADSLRDNVALRELRLDGCGVGDDGAIFVAGALAVNGSLRELRLQRNRITENGAASLADAIKVLGHTSHLHLHTHSHTQSEANMAIFIFPVLFSHCLVCDKPIHLLNHKFSSVCTCLSLSFCRSVALSIAGQPFAAFAGAARERDGRRRRRVFR